MFCTKCGKQIELKNFHYLKGSGPLVQPQTDDYVADGACDCPKPKDVLIHVIHEYVN